jgi:hypothetical protein
MAYGDSFRLEKAKNCLSPLYNTVHTVLRFLMRETPSLDETGSFPVWKSYESWKLNWKLSMGKFPEFSNWRFSVKVLVFRALKKVSSLLRFTLHTCKHTGRPGFIDDKNGIMWCHWYRMHKIFLEQLRKVKIMCKTAMVYKKIKNACSVNDTTFTVNMTPHARSTNDSNDPGSL